jgi:hypothetical protein
VQGLACRQIFLLLFFANLGLILISPKLEKNPIFCKRGKLYTDEFFCTNFLVLLAGKISVIFINFSLESNFKIMLECTENRKFWQNTKKNSDFLLVGLCPGLNPTNKKSHIRKILNNHKMLNPPTIMENSEELFSQCFGKGGWSKIPK